MFRPVPMLKVDILLLQRDLERAALSLAEAGVLHLRPVTPPPEGEALIRKTPEDRLAVSRELENRLIKVMDDLNIPATPGEIRVPADLQGLEKHLDGLENRTHRIRRRMEQVNERISRLEVLTAFMEETKDLEGDFRQLAAGRWAAVCLVRAGSAESARLAEECQAAESLVLERTTAGDLTVLLTSRSRISELDACLQRLNLSSIPLPRTVSGPFGTVLRRLRALGERCRRHAVELSGRLAALREAEGSRLQPWLRSVRAERRLLEAGKLFGYTERAAALEGWIPEKRSAELENVLHRVCGDRYSLQFGEARDDETPVQIANPFFLKPFQKILAVYGTPAYREVEPTPLLAMGFILLFGMMFGDIGHGLLLVLGGWIIRRRTRFREEGLIVIETGVSATLFGVLFGSFFGSEKLIAPLWFSPLDHIPLLIATALATGIVLILGGMGIRIYNGWRMGERMALLTDRTGVAGLLAYSGAIAAAFLIWRGVVSPLVLLLPALPLGGVFLHPFFSGEPREKKSLSVLVAEGLIEVMETVLGYLANTFSFLRVAAFGLAHAGLSLAVFALADVVSVLPFGVFWAVLVHLAGNLVILVLEGLVVSVQAVRLQFYEFFGKFFRGGGTPYRPLTLDPLLERGG